MPKRPFFKFYTADWRSDPALRMCSPTARALWIEMLCLMNEADPCGFLLVAGNKPTAGQLAALASMPVDAVESALSELESNSVFSRNRAGVIYSRRMNRDRKQREVGEKGARKRWDQDAENKRQSADPNGVSDAPPNAYKLDIRKKEEESCTGSQANHSPHSLTLALPLAPEDPGTSGPPPKSSTGRNSYPDDFEAFWRAYPKTNGSKAATFSAWRAVANQRPDLPVLLAKVEAFTRTREVYDGKIVWPDRWLKQQRWTVDFIPYQPAAPRLNETTGTNRPGYESKPSI